MPGPYLTGATGAEIIEPFVGGSGSGEVAKDTSRAVA